MVTDAVEVIGIPHFGHPSEPKDGLAGTPASLGMTIRGSALCVLCVLCG